MYFYKRLKTENCPFYSNKSIWTFDTGDPCRHLPLDPGEVPLLPPADQPGLEKLNQTQLESEQELYEGETIEIQFTAEKIVHFLSQ